MEVTYLIITTVSLDGPFETYLSHTLKNIALSICTIFEFFKVSPVQKLVL